MTTYSYQATDSSGKTIDGVIDAHSLQAARESVIALGLEPIEIYEASTSTSKEPDAPWVDAMQSSPDLEEYPEPAPATTTPSSSTTYFPLLDTLRLYAGWLLAWYCLVYAVGSYQFIKETPYHVPYAESLFLSPLVLSFTFAAYLFLLFSGAYKMSGRSKAKGVVLSIIGIAIFLLYRMNVQ
jgi:hypothetical protein